MAARLLIWTRSTDASQLRSRKRHGPGISLPHILILSQRDVRVAGPVFGGTRRHLASESCHAGDLVVGITEPRSGVLGPVKRHPCDDLFWVIADGPSEVRSGRGGERV